MKIGVRLPPFAREIGFEAFVRWLAEHGFEAVDTPPLTAEMKTACDQVGLTVGTSDVGTENLLSANPAEREKGLKVMKESITAIAAHGLRTLFTVLSPADRAMPRSETFEIWKEVYPEVVAYAEKEGVYIAVEPFPGPGPHYPNLGGTPETWRAMFEAIPSAHLGICFDPSHLIRQHIDYMRALHEFGDRVRHVHAKDTEIMAEGVYEHGVMGETFGVKYRYGGGWWRYCIPGYGEVNWGRFLHRLEEVGYDGILSIELEDHHFCETPERQKEGLLKAQAHLEPLLKQ